MLRDFFWFQQVENGSKMKNPVSVIKAFFFLKWSNQTLRGLVIGKDEEAESILSLWCSKTVLNTRVLEAEVSEN